MLDKASSPRASVEGVTGVESARKSKREFFNSSLPPDVSERLSTSENLIAPRRVFGHSILGGQLLKTNTPECSERWKDDTLLKIDTLERLPAIRLNPP